ncbi:nucleotide kinase [Klebsiella phage vB_KpnP_MUC100]|uniref:Nucleotide kinase n=1 Tax=Klebsiella phage vB_KpnP_MUC100 TaxID=3065244 RepID=A0AAX4G4S6_9CAUD|nr:nucleotide kinase [Klebsiella phage vB_KpnP_MUC100]
MTEREIQVVNLLVEQNTDRPDSTTCADGVICYKVSCSECPLDTKGTTIGEVRAMKDNKTPSVEDDGVKQPSHYQLFEGVEAIEVIARSMTQEMFKGYCLGNILKYRLRAGKKSELATLEKDMAKATFYLELYEKHKGLCHD